MVSPLPAAQLRTMLQWSEGDSFRDRDSDTADGASDTPLLLNE